MAKRIFDIIAATLGLLVLLPLFLVVSVAIAIDSKGSIFFLQERIGKYGKPFFLFKFRTMGVGADKGTAITVGNRDPRITRVGYYLRKIKMDELPQLINVLKGEMSFVGPRPEVKKFVDLYTPEQRRVLDVAPGMTDYASILFRNENELLAGKRDPVTFYVDQIMPQKLQLNLEYIDSNNLWVDIKILFKTLVVIFRK
ncbi:MAG TPA: glycosyl transferase [Cytophagales bacterium]|nr:glycosyl transferase [Cytophagales bacterium]